MTEREQRSSERQREEDRWNLWKVRVREAVVYVVCISIIVNEALFNRGNPNLALIAGMFGAMGVVPVANAVERGRND